MIRTVQPAVRRSHTVLYRNLRYGTVVYFTESVPLPQLLLRGLISCSLWSGTPRPAGRTRARARRRPATQTRAAGRCHRPRPHDPPGARSTPRPTRLARPCLPAAPSSSFWAPTWCQIQAPPYPDRMSCYPSSGGRCTVHQQVDYRDEMRPC